MIDSSLKPWLTSRPQNIHGAILVIHVGGIGDFLLSCPALSNLSSTGPLVLLGNPDRLWLGVKAGIAQTVHDIHHVGFESVFHEPSERLRQFLSPFNRAIIWLSDKDGRIKEGFHKCGLRNLQIFPGLPPSDWKRHASLYYLECLGFENASPLRLDIEPYPQSYSIIIHPGSGGKAKNWPIACYHDLAEKLRKTGLLFNWCLGPAEEDFPLPGGERAIRTETLEELARTLGSTHLYIGNDCGISHLAAAVGCRTIALFGPTDPQIWAPRGGHITILRGNPWPATEEVMMAVKEAMRTNPQCCQDRDLNSET
jgi:hypothetical protein